MKDLERQHAISLTIVLALMVWIGAAASMPCPAVVQHMDSPPSVLSGAGPMDVTDWDEHHDDRYLDWPTRPHATGRAAIR